MNELFSESGDNGVLWEINALSDERRVLRETDSSGERGVRDAVRVREIEQDIELLWCRFRVSLACLPHSPARMDLTDDIVIAEVHDLSPDETPQS